jgi:hypothetical protein
MAELPSIQYSEEWEDTQRARFDQILGRDVSNLLREASTEFNFLELKNKLETVREHVQTLAENYDYWAQLADQRRNILNQSLDDMITQFNAMDAFDPKTNNAWDLRNSLIADFNTRYNSFYDSVINPLNAYLGKKAFAEEIAGKFGQEAAKELKEIRRVKKEIEKVQVDVKEAAEVSGDVASSAHSGSFAEQAREHKDASLRWLKGLAIVAVVGLVVAVTVIYDIIRELRDDRYVANAEAYIFKLALLAFVYFGMRFFIKNYSAHQHLYVVNKHRANALKSMEAFRTSAVEDRAKDEILLAAVGAAYAQQETGFITTKEGAGSDDGDILEVIRSAIRNK